MTRLDDLELLSLALTPPTIVYAAVVFIVWGPRAVKLIKSDRPFTPGEWLIMGVVIGFLGSFADNLYYCAVWTAHYLRAPVAPALIVAGPVANIPFRLVAGIAAAYCHLRGLLSIEARWAVALGAMGLGLLYALTLAIIRNG